jgi:hypothetical protein
MSREQEAVAIIERRTTNSVNAVLHKDLDELELIDVEIAWAPKRLRAFRELRQQGVPANQLPQHVHWNWAIKAVEHSHLLAYRSFGIEADGMMQGLMMVRLTGKLARLDPDKGKPVVYVDFVETAPWNAKEFTASPIYKGVGVRLIQAAARLSIDEGFSGRVGLHSLPQSRPFYTNACEMQALGPDAGYGNLEYFELTAAKAAELLNK